MITLRLVVLRELAAYLSEEKEFFMIDEVLDGLDKAQILHDPPGDSEAAAQYDLTVLRPASRRILQLIAIFKSLSHIEGTVDETNSIKERCFRELVERWGAVTKWIFHFLAEKQRSHPWDILFTLQQWICLVSVSLLKPLLSQIDGDRYKEELVSLPDTMDLVFALLCSTDQQTGKHCDVYKERKENICCLLEKVWLPLTMSYQRQVVKALISRAKEFVDNLQTETHLNTAIYNLGTLFDVSSSLSWETFFDTGTSIWRLLDRQNFLYEYATAVYKVTQKGVELNIRCGRLWSLINHCVTRLTLMAVFAAPNPIDTIPQLIKGGLLRCLLAGLPVTIEFRPPASHPLVIEALRMIYPFLYVEKVFSALKDAGGLSLIDAWDGTASTAPANGIIEEWAALLRWSTKAYDELRMHEELNINMCNNGKCPLHLAGKGMGRIQPKVCRSCHAATYCSKECQREDWMDFHEAECAGLGRLYYDHKLSGRWPSWRTRRDQLIFLQLLANCNSPPPLDLKKNGASTLITFPKVDPTSLPWTRPHYDQGLALTVVDLVSDRHLHVLAGIPIAYLNHSFWVILNDTLDRRIESCVRDMERNQDSVIIVEGKFALDQRYIMHVFVKMRWDANAPDMERYRIVNHAFRMGNLDLAGSSTSWLFENRKQLEELEKVPFESPNELLRHT